MFGSSASVPATVRAGRSYAERDMASRGGKTEAKTAPPCAVATASAGCLREVAAVALFAGHPEEVRMHPQVVRQLRVEGARQYPPLAHEHRLPPV